MHNNSQSAILHIFIILTINPCKIYLKTHIRNDETSMYQKAMIITCVLKITAFNIDINMKIAHTNYNSMFS